MLWLQYSVLPHHENGANQLARLTEQHTRGICLPPSRQQSIEFNDLGKPVPPRVSPTMLQCCSRFLRTVWRSVLLSYWLLLPICACETPPLQDSTTSVLMPAISPTVCLVSPALISYTHWTSEFINFHPNLITDMLKGSDWKLRLLS